MRQAFMPISQVHVVTDAKLFVVSFYGLHPHEVPLSSIKRAVERLVGPCEYFTWPAEYSDQSYAYRVPRSYIKRNITDGGVSW